MLAHILVGLRNKGSNVFFFEGATTQGVPGAGVDRSPLG